MHDSRGRAGQSVRGETTPSVPGRSRAVVSGARWLSISQLSVQATRLVVSIVLARLLDPSAFGLLALAMIVTQFLDMFMDLGTGTAIIQQKHLSRRLASSIFFLNCLLGVVLAAAMLMFAPAFAAVFGTPEAVPVLRVMSLAVLISSLGLVQNAMLRRNLKFAQVAFATFASAAANGLVAIPLAATGAGVWSLVAGTISGVLVFALVVWSLSRWYPALHFSLTDLRQVASFSGNISLFNLIGFGMNHADKLIIGRYLGASALGVYAMGDRAFMYPLRTITRVIQEVLFPAFSRVQDDNESIRRGYVRACSVIALVVLPAMLGLAVVSGPFVRVVLGTQWVEAIPLVAMLAPAGAVQAISRTGGILYRAKGRADLLFRWGLVAGVITIAGYFVGLRWGLVGVAAAYAIVTVLLAGPYLLIPFQLVELRFASFLRALWPYALSSLIMVVAVLSLRLTLEGRGVDEALVLVASVGTGIGVYGLMLYWWRPPAIFDLVEVAGLRALGGRLTRR